MACTTPNHLCGGINVDAEKEFVSIPAGKILKAQLLLENPLLGAGVTKLPINLIQKLRGKWNSGVPAGTASKLNALLSIE